MSKVWPAQDCLRDQPTPFDLRPRLRRNRDAYVCRETVYKAIYALLVGKLRKELISDFAKARQLVDRTPAA